MRSQMERDRQENAKFLGDFDELFDIKNSTEELALVENLAVTPAEVYPISIESVMEMIFTPGEIYWKKKSGKLIKVLRAGEAVDVKAVTKFKERKMDLAIKWMSSTEMVDLVSGHFEQLKNAINELERVELRKKILEWFKESYWRADKKANFLDLTQIGEKVFYTFNEEMSEILKGTSQMIFERAALVGTIGVFSALALGHTDFKTLQDIYGLCYLFDFAFDKNSYSFNLNKATELERAAPGDGVAFLIVGEDTGPELGPFMQHTFRGARLARERCGKFFHSEGILKNITIHHERINGNGFPLRINEDEMSDVEELIIFLNSVIPYRCFNYELNDAKGFFKKIVYESEVFGLNESITKRFKKMIIKVMEGIGAEENPSPIPSIVEATK